MSGCKDDNSASCTATTFSFEPHTEMYRQSVKNIDSMTYKRERYGKVDTVIYVRDTIIENFVVSKECPDYFRNFQRNSIRYKSLLDDKLVIEILQVSTGAKMITFIGSEILYTKATNLANSFILETGTFNNCNISINALNAYSYVPGYSEKVIIEGDIDLVGHGETTSRSYFNLEHGVVYISLYENTDSLTTYQRIL